MHTLFLYFETMALTDGDAVKGAVASNGSESDRESLEAGSLSERKLLRKIDLRLLPPVSILYLLSFLDRSNGELSSQIKLNVL